MTGLGFVLGLEMEKPGFRDGMLLMLSEEASMKHLSYYIPAYDMPVQKSHCSYPGLVHFIGPT